jgi:hypothetical protein
MFLEQAFVCEVVVVTTRALSGPHVSPLSKRHNGQKLAHEPHEPRSHRGSVESRLSEEAEALYKPSEIFREPLIQEIWES